MDENLTDPEEKRVEELIGGEKVVQPPACTNHVLVAGNIYALFAQYLNGKPCVPIYRGSAVYLTAEDEFIPDVMVVCDAGKIQEDGVHGTPDLVVEVLSPATARNDRIHKKDVYARCGVSEYWLVSPSDRIVEVYRADKTGLVLHDVYGWPYDWDLKQMSEEERAALQVDFRCGLFDDLDISLEDIFSRTL